MVSSKPATSSKTHASKLPLAIASVLVGIASVAIWVIQREPGEAVVSAKSDSKPVASVVGPSVGDPRLITSLPSTSPPVQGSIDPELSARLRKLWAEYSAADKPSDFYAKYRNYPAGTTERFLAEYKRLSCGSLASIGPAKYVKFAERRRRNLPKNELEDKLQREQISAYVTRCTDLLNDLRPELLSKELDALIAGNFAESKALGLQRAAMSGASPKDLISNSGELLLSENPFVVQTVASLWKAAAEKEPDLLRSSIFNGASPNVVEAAWMLAACDFGMDCSAHNEVVQIECLISRRCNFDSVRSYYQAYILSPADFQLAQRLQIQIQQSIRSKDLRPIGISGGIKK